MKSLTIIKTLFIAFAFTSFFACSNDDDAGGAAADYNSISAGTINLDLDGNAWSSINVTGLSSVTISTITATGTTDLLFMVLEDTQVGEYVTTETSGSSLTYRTLTGSENLTTDDRAGATGRINIAERDEDNKTISGTFMGTLIDEDGNSKTITNGLFNKISYGN